MKTAKPLLIALLACTLPMGAAMAQSTNAKHEQMGHGSEQPITDTWITTKVKAALLADDQTSGTDISVQTVDGIVTLTGVVENSREAAKAIDLAEHVEGVKDVNSRDLIVSRN